MIVLDVVDLPPLLPLALVATCLRLLGDFVRMPQSRRAFAPDTRADLKARAFKNSPNINEEQSGLVSSTAPFSRVPRAAPRADSGQLQKNACYC